MTAPDLNQSVFVDNDGVRIHALDNGRVDAPLPPVLVVPGMGEYADEYTWLLDALGERRVVIVDVRGRGRSDVPDAGYRWEDHIGDLHAVVGATGLDRPVVVAFSRGSSYALGYALEHPTGLRGLVVGDELAAQWQAALPSVELVMLADAGHDLWSRDVDAYLAVLLPFVARCV